MGRVIYQVRLKVKPEAEAGFNEWYEGQYIPKLMRETPHFSAVRRYEGTANGDKIYVTEYETTSQGIDLAMSEMRSPQRAEDNAQFYAWRDRAITLHESMQLTERFSIERSPADR